MKGNSTRILVDGREFKTLRDILPSRPGLRMLFVGKVPAPGSVEAGHYFQGTQGTYFWNQLRRYGLLVPTTEFEDDSLLDHGYGLTDIVKVPRDYGSEPSDAEYAGGSDQIHELVKVHRPRVVVFIYKRVLDKILEIKWPGLKSSDYGFCSWLDHVFRTHVFVFPMCGLRDCKSKTIVAAMRALAEFIREAR